jgi:hypothetical protein
MSNGDRHSKLLNDVSEADGVGTRSILSKVILLFHQNDIYMYFFLNLLK